MKCNFVWSQETETCVSIVKIYTCKFLECKAGFPFRYHGQAVRQRSAKPLFPGSNPGGTSILGWHLEFLTVIQLDYSSLTPKLSVPRPIYPSDKRGGNPNVSANNFMLVWRNGRRTGLKIVCVPHLKNLICRCGGMADARDLKSRG